MSEVEVRIELVSQIRDERLRRIVLSRAGGSRFQDIAEAEGISNQRAQQLWANGRRLLDFLSKVPPVLTADSFVEYTLTSVRFRNVCALAGIKTLGDLAGHTRDQFELYKNCRHKTADEAERLLAEAGLTFRNGVRRRAMNHEWQPIETAPKDGEHFLVTYGEWVTIAFWDRDPESEGGECFREYSPDMERVDRFGVGTLVHWMPLPEPPKDSEVMREKGDSTR